MTTNRTRPICAWLSRHDPTPEQERSLRGYDIIPVRSPKRFQGGYDALAQMLIKCDRRRPALIMAVMPNGMLAEFMVALQQKGLDIPVIQADFHAGMFTGWRQVMAVHCSVVSVSWMPALQAVG